MVLNLHQLIEMSLTGKRIVVYSDEGMTFDKVSNSYYHELYDKEYVVTVQFVRPPEKKSPSTFSIRVKSESGRYFWLNVSVNCLLSILD